MKVTSFHRKYTTLTRTDKNSPKTVKIIGQRGKHEIGALTSGELGVNTCVCCFSAAHVYTPYAIFKRLRFKDELKEGAPHETAFSCSGWITSELFVKWLRYFIKFSMPSKDNNVLGWSYNPHQKFKGYYASK